MDISWYTALTNLTQPTPMDIKPREALALCTPSWDGVKRLWRRSMTPSPKMATYGGWKKSCTTLDG